MSRGTIRAPADTKQVKARLRHCLTVLSWSAANLGQRIGRDGVVVWRWGDERYSETPPPEILEWLEGVTSHLAANPPPTLSTRIPRRPRAALRPFANSGSGERVRAV